MPPGLSNGETDTPNCKKVPSTHRGMEASLRDRLSGLQRSGYGDKHVARDPQHLGINKLTERHQQAPIKPG